jgi:hypothetical protein
MTFSAASILSALDELADTFEFPGFNNMHYETADSRLRAYRGEGSWAILIEELVDWPAADGIMCQVFGAGTALTVPPGLLPRIDRPLIEPAFIEDVIPDRVRLRDHEIAVDSSAIARLVDEHAISPAFALLVTLRDAHRDVLFHTEAELAAFLQPDQQLMLALEQWQHPDVYGGPAPSEEETFPQIADVLASGDPSRYRPTQPPNNRDWLTWLRSK